MKRSTPCSWSLLIIVVVAAAAARTAHCGAVSGTSTASIGKDVVIDTQPTPVGGRRAGPQDQNQQRQATVPEVGINDPSLLPDCRPGNGIICSDRDYTSLLQAQPANIDLTGDNFAYVGLDPKAEASLGLDTKAELAARSFSTAAKAIGKGELKGNIGTEVATADTETTNTVAGAAIKNNRYELLVPEKVTITLDKTDSANSLERRSNKPNFYYIFGQNFGQPVGFALAKDGVTGKRR